MFTKILFFYYDSVIDFPLGQRTSFMMFRRTEIYG